MPVLPSDAKEIVTSSTECLDLLSWMLQNCFSFKT